MAPEDRGPSGALDRGRFGSARDLGGGSLIPPPWFPCNPSFLILGIASPPNGAEAWEHDRVDRWGWAPALKKDAGVRHLHGTCGYRIGCIAPAVTRSSWLWRYRVTASEYKRPVEPICHTPVPDSHFHRKYDSFAPGRAKYVSTEALKPFPCDSMKYLIRLKKGKARAHLWNGSDTVCRMWSTGGLRARRQFLVCDTPEGRKICHMCQAVTNKLTAQKAEGIVIWGDNWEDESSFNPF